MGVQWVRRCSHIWSGIVSLEDVAAGETDPGLDVGRPQHLGVRDAVAEVRREVLDEVDELLLHLGPTAVPGALRSS